MEKNKVQTMKNKIFTIGSEALERQDFYTRITFFFLLVQGFIIWITTINIPHADEWENLVEHALPSGFNWQFIFAFHNEHRVVFTKLMNYLFLYISDWNLKFQILGNYFVWVMLVVFLMYVQKKYILNSTKGIWILIFFLSSPLLIENHTWGFQSCFHFYLLFGLLSIFTLIRSQANIEQRDSKLGLDFMVASLLALFSLYSFAAGMFFAAICLVMMVIKLLSIKRVSHANRALGLIALIMLCLGMGLWLVGYEKPMHHPSMMMPYKWAFWTFFTNLISLGFGYKTESIFIAFVAGGIVLFVLLKSWRKALQFREPFFVFAFFSSLALLGSILSMTLSRAGFGLGQAKVSRYSEVGVLLMLFVGWLLWDYCRVSQNRARIYKYFIWFVFLGFAGDYSYSRYFAISTERSGTIDCILKYYKGENPTAYCPSSYPGSLAGKLEVAKKMNLSWLP